jgi:hypothetical protein
MNSSLAGVADGYLRKYGTVAQADERLRELYSRYIKEREASILDAVAATAALNVLAFGDQVDTDAITPQMEEAFRLAFSNVAVNMTLAERFAELGDSSEEARRGFLSALKGKYFEVIVRDNFNAGISTGDLIPGPGQTAQLAQDPTQPGWDLRIFNCDGALDEALQLKATDSLRPIRNALENGDIRVLTTNEAADLVVGGSLDPENVLRSGISDSSLEAEVAAPLEPLLDSQLENIFEHVAPGLPFVLIAAVEGTKVLMGRQVFEDAVHRCLDRGVKTGAGIAVGGLFALVGAGVISLPATFLTRIGIDRYRVQSGLSRQVRANADLVRAIMRP